MDRFPLWLEIGRVGRDVRVLWGLVLFLSWVGLGFLFGIGGADVVTVVRVVVWCVVECRQLHCSFDRWLAMVDVICCMLLWEGGCFLVSSLSYGVRGARIVRFGSTIEHQPGDSNTHFWRVKDGLFRSRTGPCLRFRDVDGRVHGWGEGISCEEMLGEGCL